MNILDARYAGIIHTKCQRITWMDLINSSPDDIENTAISIRLIIMDMIASAPQVRFVWIVLSQYGRS